MADVKKPDKKFDKPAVAPAKQDPFIEIVSLFAVIFFVLFLLNGLVTSITSSRLFSGGFAGLTPQGIMARHTRSIASLLNPIGVRVVSISQNTDVYDSAGGKKIGTQPFNARGKILQGAVIIDRDSYWYVDYDSGKDGWVKESDIAFLDSEPSFIENLILWFWAELPYFKLFSVFLSILFIAWIAYVVMKLTEIRRNQYALLFPTVEMEDFTQKNTKWEKILVSLESLNENDWKQAIIEADIMLDEIIDKLSLPGDTMGEKMKAVEKSDFTTIDLAWEAHKVRNQIAHEGNDFVLTQREARRVIALYQAIFEEFQVI